MKAICFSALLVLIPLKHAYAWGQEGHSIVAEIAQRRLDRDTLRKVKTLLGGEIALASVASWADDYRAAHGETAGWHFVDIPYERNTYEAAVDCKTDPEQGDCIINALDRVQKTLADCTKPNGERFEALKFLIHFVGDVHQPLHAAERNGDHGGNDVHVTFFGKNVNLHAVWDTEIIMHTVFAWGTYVSRLEAKWFPGHDLSGLIGGTPVDWALESHKFARDVAYDFPADTHLDMDYYNKSVAVVDQQLALAGVRLARILQETLRSTASCP
jgi:hypothetical protein